MLYVLVAVIIARAVGVLMFMKIMSLGVVVTMIRSLPLLTVVISVVLPKQMLIKRLIGGILRRR